MTRNDLIDAIAAEGPGSKADAKAIVDAVFEQLAAALSNGDEIRINNFGTFTTSRRAAREGRNPRSGEIMRFAASTAVRFKPSKVLKDRAQG